MLAVDKKQTAPEKRARFSHIWQRDERDHYIEPQWVSERLFEDEDFDRNRVLLDPCTGFGRIAAAAARAGYRVTAADIVDRGFPGTHVQDFLTRKSAPPSVVGNPPFNAVEAFARHALDTGARKTALIFPVARLNAARWLRDLPLRRVWLLTPRPSMPPGAVIYADHEEKRGPDPRTLPVVSLERDSYKNTKHGGVVAIPVFSIIRWTEPPPNLPLIVPPASSSAMLFDGKVIEHDHAAPKLVEPPDRTAFESKPFARDENDDDIPF
jgi:hypothetical protein